MINLLLKATGETLLMVIASGMLTILLGLPYGIYLVITRASHIMPNRIINQTLSSIANLTRSLPFIILMIFMMPFTRWIVGTSIGTKAAIVPLVFAATPFFARLVETALLELDPGIIEAADAMGATPFQVVTKVMLPEALPGLVMSVTTMLINLIGYSAMAGAVGGGGIGDLAIRYGFHRFRIDIMLATIVLLIILVQSVQSSGNHISKHLLSKRRK